MKKTLSSVTVTLFMCAFSSAHAVGLGVRLGQGGLWDDRASNGVLGGGQLALDVRLNTVPIAFQVASEYWNTGSLDDPYEIESYEAVKVLVTQQIGNLMSFLYTKPVVRKTDYLYLGAGIGRISVPKIENPDERERCVAYDAVGGVHIGIFWKLGLFAEGKYLYSSKTIDNIKVIDFSDFGILAGVSLIFDL
ncbi:hypothetical protein AMJ74_06625 [candidate division WOR_3 bacterium SM1_77]|uniref:Outer membrane protein beta-barrel domain-containing protein n=1 Tax=candidate division WOR_3 bacterium SM1_77 TaxID=1703778 RepID=A0A0S8JUS1_UNCW3|nr:MAG: hypothetical protein AMJ74_06625 [candidate division WOR_3 bacterium SM1_77]